MLDGARHRGGVLSDKVARVGQRIRAMREDRGWSQADLAARLGRTQTAVSYWESGNRAIGVDDLVELAEVFGVTTGQLLPDTPRRPVPALLRAVAEQVDAAQLADELERFALEADDIPRPEALWKIAPASPRDTAEALLAAAGVTKPPIDVEALAAGTGVRVVPRLVHDIDGLVVELDSGPAIWVNRDQAWTRQRFTIAHELGHYLLRHSDRFHVDFGGDLAPSATGEHPGYSWRAERAANDFAANLLMPAPMVREAFKLTEEVKFLATQFDVSPAAMGFRLSALRLQ
jgi:Zn-dependent peptidase ImmA (M78 family)/DNA-binding XRE family transcriptional regulator